MKDKKLVEAIMDLITNLLGLEIVPLTLEDFSDTINLVGEYAWILKMHYIWLLL